MFYMLPNAKFISVHITSSISNVTVCLQEVVGVAIIMKIQTAMMGYAISFPETNTKQHITTG